MSEHDLKLLCNYAVAVVILVVFAFILGIFFERSIEFSVIHTEQYYQCKSAEIYTLATDYICCKENAEKINIKKKLKKAVKIYNRETRDIKKWTFRCPKTFTLEYLTGEE